MLCFSNTKDVFVAFNRIAKGTSITGQLASI